MVNSDQVVEDDCLGCHVAVCVGVMFGLNADGQFMAASSARSDCDQE